MKTWKIILFLQITVLAAISGPCEGQTLSITVKDKDKLPLPGAVIQLTNINTSEREFRTADLSGVSRFDKLSEGLYTLNISFVGFRPVEATINVTSGIQKLEYQMIEDAVMMKEIVVAAGKPVLRQEDDKMIIDVEPIASLSTNTLEILESTPGLLVDQDGGVFLSSSTPAVIFINGREQKMSSQDIMTLLRSLPPGSVQRIEVIRTPSAKYSASASGGIVNVILKRGVKIGRFGSVRTGMNQGVYGNRFAGFSINNSEEHSTGYLNFEYSYNDMQEELSSVRDLNPDSILSQSSQTRRKAHQGYMGYGISFDAGKKINLSYDGRINGSGPESVSNNTNNISSVLRDKVFTETYNLLTGKSKFLSIRQEFGALYRIDTTGSEWDTKLSYALNNNDGTQNYLYSFIHPSSADIQGEGTNDYKSNLFQLQSDLTYELPLKIRLETGINCSWQVFNSSSDYVLVSGESRIADPLRTKSYRYNERINAGYLQASRELLWKVLLKTGIRMEHTFMNGIQSIPSDTSFKVSRADWFPYIYVSRPVFSIAGFELRAYGIYRRTISRPSYENLNPSVRSVDQYLYETGNPALKPQFTDNLEVNISFDDMPIFAFGRNYTHDIFSSVIYKDKTNENVVIRTFDNLGKNTETYLRVIAGIPPVKKYFFYFGAQYNLSDYDGIYEGSQLAYERGSWRFFTYHSLRFTPNTRLTLNGLLVTKGQMNFYELDNFGQLNIGLNQSFFNKKLTVTLSARDIFRTMSNKFRLDQGGVHTWGERYSDTRRFGINVLYNFGIPEKHEKDKKAIFEPEE